MKCYTVFTGARFKGFWTDEALAVGYMASRSLSERKAWALLVVDTSADCSAEVEVRVKSGGSSGSRKSGGKGVDHLKAESLSVVAKAK